MRSDSLPLLFVVAVASTHHCGEASSSCSLIVVIEKTHSVSTCSLLPLQPTGEANSLCDMGFILHLWFVEPCDPLVQTQHQSRHRTQCRSRVQVIIVIRSTRAIDPDVVEKSNC
jgi:hypothetical protein